MLSLYLLDSGKIYENLYSEYDYSNLILSATMSERR